MVDREKLFKKLFVEEKLKLTPSLLGNGLSGQQIAFAKGRAFRRFKDIIDKLV